MPSSVDGDRTWFDRFADGASALASRAAFFAFAVLLVVVWAPSFWLFGDVDTWQLAINTPTTVGTWLLVALLQNSQRRADLADQHKQNAIAGALAELMRATVEQGGDLDAEAAERLERAYYELRDAVGLEERESA